jgi:DNA-binding MarR family transcriptional regulator
MNAVTPAGALTPAAAGPGSATGSACAGALADDLGWALGVVFRSYARAARDAIADVPGGPRGYQVLTAAIGGELGSQLALAQHLGVDRTVMTYLLDDLENAGLIERRPDPADRRARRITATPAGTRLAGQLDRRLRAAEERLLASLGSDTERQSFRALLRQLAADISVSDPSTSACTVQSESC